MKILFLSGSNSRNAGGVFITALETGRKLIHNHGVTVNYLMYNDDYSSVDIEQYPEKSLKIYSIFGPSNFGFSINQLALIRDIKPDIIHTQTLWLYLSYVVNNYWHESKTPIVVSPHGMLDKYQLKTSSFKKKLAMFFFQRRNLKLASCIHALNLLEYKSIRELGFTNPIAIIPNGVNLPSRVLIPQLPLWKNPNKKTLLFLSRIDPKKNIHSLLQAWLLSAYKTSGWELVIAGDLKNQDYVNELMSISKKEISIKFVGGQFNEDKDAAFFHSDAFILPSFSEGLPMAILEAWSYKKFCLITEECNLPIAFEENICQKISTNVESIVEGLDILFKMSDNERKIKGERSYELVKDQFTWDSVADKFNELYKWIVSDIEKPNFVFLE